MEHNPIVLIYSGGLDSTVLLCNLMAKYKAENICTLNFNYGSKHNYMERESARKITNLYGIKMVELELTFIKELFNSSLLDPLTPVPHGHYAANNMKSTVVPFRNGIMLSIATGYADSIGANKVYIASHAGDHFIYPDCRPEFTGFMSAAMCNGTFNRVHLIAPFNQFTKTEIVAIGAKYDVPFNLTYSCYEGQEKHCGKCGTCVERLEAFSLNNLSDPVFTE